jgi:hypothetical protein
MAHVVGGVVHNVDMGETHHENDEQPERHRKDRLNGRAGALRGD